MSAPVDTRPSERAQSVVALGGGHGLSATLRSLRRLHADLVIDASLVSIESAVDQVKALLSS